MIRTHCSGTGADAMKRIAAPMIGGMISLTILTLVIIPAVYFLWRSREVRSEESSVSAWSAWPAS